MIFGMLGKDFPSGGKFVHSDICILRVGDGACHYSFPQPPLLVDSLF
jgi:hypothetical protein